MKIFHNKYCVYTHSIDGVVFYVGKGRSYRPFEFYKRNDLWNDLVSKNESIDIEIVCWYEKSDDAVIAEAKLIKEHSPSCNQFLNGYTTSDYQKKRCSETHKGKKLSDKTKKEIGDRTRGRPSPMKGIPRTEETKNKLSRANKGRAPHNKGVPCSIETRAQLLENSMRTANPVICISTGERYISAKLAARELEIPYSTMRAHLNGKLIHARGMKFKYQ